MGRSVFVSAYPVFACVINCRLSGNDRVLDVVPKMSGPKCWNHNSVVMLDPSDWGTILSPEVTAG